MTTTKRASVEELRKVTHNECPVCGGGNGASCADVHTAIDALADRLEVEIRGRAWFKAECDAANIEVARLTALLETRGHGRSCDCHDLTDPTFWETCAHHEHPYTDPVCKP